jgi:hypothetical protein
MTKFVAVLAIQYSVASPVVTNVSRLTFALSGWGGRGGAEGGGGGQEFFFLLL